MRWERSEILLFTWRSDSVGRGPGGKIVGGTSWLGGYGFMGPVRRRRGARMWRRTSGGMVLRVGCEVDIFADIWVVVGGRCEGCGSESVGEMRGEDVSKVCDVNG